MSSDWRRCNSTARKDAGSGGDVQWRGVAALDLTVMMADFRRRRNSGAALDGEERRLLAKERQRDWRPSSAALTLAVGDGLPAKERPQLAGLGRLGWVGAWAQEPSPLLGRVSVLPRIQMPRGVPRKTSSVPSTTSTASRPSTATTIRLSPSVVPLGRSITAAAMSELLAAMTTVARAARASSALCCQRRAPLAGGCVRSPLSLEEKEG
ncbi:unnamed protein product [Cuscuta campestris]|uniref:Uncharacterized protein n=1 Tax=Cuscuta campestris TaxID=132261 RepID=A0A484LMD5_9ASTE|nr:unnamed protein product [Cuscuta campestris]